MKNILKKVGLGVATLAVIVPGAAAFSAFEAHVINVTARIENALNVPVELDGLDFGTVFPQESLDEQFTVVLSESFEEQSRVNAVDYEIRQKPKCVRVTEEDLPQFGRVIEDPQNDGEFICEDEVNYDIMPLLCPYLSKAEITDDPDDDDENDGEPLAAFHGPIFGWNLGDTLAWLVSGRLDQSINDNTDEWLIDLQVPCFEGQCAQDWPEFVNEHDDPQNPADPDEYIQPTENEHELFGCDLWLEVTGFDEDSGT